MAPVKTSMFFSLIHVPAKKLQKTAVWAPKKFTCFVCLLRLVCGGGHVKWCHEVAKAVRIVIFKLFVASCCDSTHEANIIDT